MALMSDELTLENINNAISAIMAGGQSYKIGSRSLTRANLTELRNLRNQIIEEQAGNTASADDTLRGTSIALFSGR
jgi:hypothetical protein